MLDPFLSIPASPIEARQRPAREGEVLLFQFQQVRLKLVEARVVADVARLSIPASPIEAGQCDAPALAARAFQFQQVRLKLGGDPPA